MEEKRQSQRKRVLKPGKVVFGDFAMLYDCSVKDLSERGAKLRVEEGTRVPSEFYLYLPLLRQMYKAQVKWRRGELLGIRFEGGAIDISNHKDPRCTRLRLI
jgi:PilZ domain